MRTPTWAPLIEPSNKQMVYDQMICPVVIYVTAAPKQLENVASLLYAIASSMKFLNNQINKVAKSPDQDQISRHKYQWSIIQVN